MVATAFPCDREDVSVIRLSQPRVRPHSDRIVALEVTEDPSAGFARAMEPGTFAAPDKGVALARVALDSRVLLVRLKNIPEPIQIFKVLFRARRPSREPLRNGGAGRVLGDERSRGAQQGFPAVDDDRRRVDDAAYSGCAGLQPRLGATRPRRALEGLQAADRPRSTSGPDGRLSSATRCPRSVADLRVSEWICARRGLRDRAAL